MGVSAMHTIFFFLDTMCSTTRSTTTPAMPPAISSKLLNLVQLLLWTLSHPFYSLFSHRNFQRMCYFRKSDLLVCRNFSLCIAFTISFSRVDSVYSTLLLNNVHFCTFLCVIFCPAADTLFFVTTAAPSLTTRPWRVDSSVSLYIDNM